MANEELRVRIAAQVQGLDQVESLKNAVRQLQSASTPAAADLKKLKDAAIQLGSATGRTESDLRRSISVLRDVKSQLSLTDEEYKKLTNTINRYQAQLDKATGAQQRQSRGMKFAQTAGAVAASGVFGGPEGLVGAGIGAFFGPGGALAGGAIGAQVGMVRQQLAGTATLAADLEKQRTALRLVLKDSAEYNASLRFLSKISREYAIPQDRLVKGFTQLAASVAGAGGNINDTATAFQGIAAGIRGTGGSLENLDGALLATSQVFSKGKVSAEELRGQIGERLPGAFTLFAESIGKTPQQLDKALQDGEVTLGDFLKFSKTLFGEYGENAKIIADSPAAAGDRLQKNLTDLGVNVGQLLKPIGAAFQNTFSEIVKIINEGAKALKDFLRIGGGPGQEIAKLNSELIVQRRVLARAEDLPEIKIGGFEQGTRTFQVTNAERAIARIEADIKVQKALVKATTDAQKDKPSRLNALDTKVGDTVGSSGKAAAAAAARENASDLKNQLMLQRRIAAVSLEAQRPLIEAKQQAAELEREILDAQASGNLKQALVIQQDKLRLGFIGDIARIRADEVTKLQANADAEDQTNRALADQAVRGDAMNKIRDRAVDQQIALNKLVDDAARQATQQSLEIGRLTDQKLFDMGLITQKQLEEKNLDREILELRRQFGLVNEGLLEDYIKLLQAQSALKDSFSFNFIEPLKAAYEESQNLGASLGNVAVSAIGGLADAFVNFAATGKASFSDFARSVLLDLSKIFARMAIFQAISGIFPGLNLGGGAAGGGGEGFLGGAVDRLLGPASAKGNIFAQNGVVPFANGGIVNRPTMFPFAKGIGLMGEAGPEAIMPLKRGADGKLGVASAGGSGVTVNVSVDAKGTQVQGDPGQGAQLGRVVAGAVQQELIKQQRPGGLLAGGR